MVNFFLLCYRKESMLVSIQSGLAEMGLKMCPEMQNGPGNVCLVVSLWSFDELEG